jgi:hypothetical protein
MNTIFNTKAFTKQLPDLPADILAAVPKLYDRPILAENAKRIAEQKKGLAEAEKRRAQFYEGPARPTPRLPGKHADAQKFLAGEPLEGQSRDTELAILQREIDARREAVVMAEAERRSLYVAEITGVCNELPDSCKKIFFDVLDAAETLNAALEKLVKFNAYAASRGLEADKRPLRWQICNHWKWLYFGSNGLEPLAHVIERRRVIWEQEGK